MRFDKVIELINVVTVEDGLGGRTEGESVISSFNANIEELGIESTMKIYGDATTDTIKAIILGRVLSDEDKTKKFKFKYNDKYYKIVSKRFVKNKTCYLLEVIDND